MLLLTWFHAVIAFFFDAVSYPKNGCLIRFCFL
jgi:hypothetical protein